MINVIASRTIGTRILEMDITINNAKRLTPKTARAALIIAFGNDSDGEVWDHNKGYGYRIYKGSVRKLYTED